MDTFRAVPEIIRFNFTVIDQEKLEEFYESTDLEAKIPTISKIFVGYCKGAGCPVPVALEVDRIEREYEAEIPKPIDVESTTWDEQSEYIKAYRRVNMLLRRNLLLAVIRNLDVDSANLLATEQGDGWTALARLGYISPRPEDRNDEEEKEEEQVVDDMGEVKEVDETGESISSISQPSTQE